MNFNKYTSAQVIYYLRHNKRDRPKYVKEYGNKSIDSNLSSNNYSIVSRGETAEDANNYRLEMEKNIYKMNRKNIIHGLEYVLQAPPSCPPELERVFFEETVNYIASIIPLGMDGIIDATVHMDEKHKAPSGTVISRSHIHIICIPAVLDTKHENFKYKLCCDELTKRKKLHQFYPGLQAHLDKVGVPVKAYNPTGSSGKTNEFVHLTANQLKEITKETGTIITRSMKVSDIVNLISQNRILENKLKTLVPKEKLAELQTKNRDLEASLNVANKEIEAYKSRLISAEKDLAKEREITASLNSEIDALKADLKSKEVVLDTEPEWGQKSTWGVSDSWSRGIRSIDETIDFN